MNICLIAVLGTGLLCSGGNKPPVVISDYCRSAAYAVAKIQAMPEAERSVLPRLQKQANASIVQKYGKDCKP